MWSSSGMQQELPATGAGRAFLLSSPPWAMQVAGLMTTASGAGGNSTGSDKRGKSQMGASSTSSSPASSTAGEAGASCTQPTTAEAPAPAAASQEFARGALSEEQATRDQQEADKANYAGEGGKGTADGGPTGERGAELPSGGGDVDAPRMTEIRDRLMDAQLDAREDARDWIKDKRDDMNTMQEVRCERVRKSDIWGSVVWTPVACISWGCRCCNTMPHIRRTPLRKSLVACSYLHILFVSICFV